MEGPKTPAGDLTEKIMHRVRQRLPQLPTHLYNPIWEAVLAELQNEFEKTPSPTPPLTRLEFLRGLSQKPGSKSQ